MSDQTQASNHIIIKNNGIKNKSFKLLKKDSIVFSMQIKIVGTEEGPHLWPKRLTYELNTCKMFFVAFKFYVILK